MGLRPGKLVLVVGPSGVGKDTLINGAREALQNDPRYSFVRRIVTRKADVVLEDHDTVDAETFATLDANQRLALSWEAHGLRYGLPLSVITDIALGKVVIANGSRHIIPLAREKFPGCSVMLVTAEISLRAARLAQRGRENSDQIAARMAREAAPLPNGIDPTIIDNSGTPAIGIARLIMALHRVTDQLGGNLPTV